MLEKDFSVIVLINPVCLAASASRSSLWDSRLSLWISNWVTRMSFRSFAKEEDTVTVLEMSLDGVDVACKPMEAYVMTSGVLVLDDNDDEDGFDEDVLEAATAVC